MTTGSGEALAPVIQQLTDLIHRLDEQQHAEEEHKVPLRPPEAHPALPERPRFGNAFFVANMHFSVRTCFFAVLLDVGMDVQYFGSTDFCTCGTLEMLVRSSFT